MQTSLLKILGCPKCHGALSCEAAERAADGDVTRGDLQCTHCGTRFAITAGIPRFVAETSYASSFGYQWNQFRKDQIDCFNGGTRSEARFFAETGWTKASLTDTWVLDAGCGAGRFMDVASRAGCNVVGVDISSAVDAARMNMDGRRNVHLVQASIYALPFRTGSFDACYCIGVIQHTPDPSAALRALPRLLKEGGRFAVTIYERRPWTALYSKYLLRRFTKRLDDRLLLGIVRGLMPILFPVSEVLFRVPVLGRYFAFLLPVANYVDKGDLTLRQRYQLAILDTFDMLSPQFDQPQTQPDVVRALSEEGIEGIDRLPNPGLNLIGRKATG